MSVLWLVSAPEALRVRRVAARGSGGSGGGGRCGGGERPPSDGAVDLAEGSRAANIEWIRKHSAGFESPHGHHPYVELINDLEGDEAMLQDRITELLLEVDRGSGRPKAGNDKESAAGTAAGSSVGRRGRCVGWSRAATAARAVSGGGGWALPLRPVVGVTYVWVVAPTLPWHGRQRWWAA